MALTFSSPVPARRKVHSDGFSYLNLNASAFGERVDPFLNLDHFRMSERPFPPRPLAGFAAVTAVLESSPGGFVGRDHLGHRARVGPGGFYGLVSGSGMIAEEMPYPGTTCEGIHVSINLPARAKREPPRSFALDPAQVKERKPNPQIRGRVYLGKLAGAESPAELPFPCSFFEFHSRAKMSVTPRVLPESGGFVYLLSGRLRLSAGDEFVGLDALQAVGFANGEKDAEILIETIEEAHFVFLSGRACREPVIAHGGFVMSTSAEIADAIARYQGGEMGELEPTAEE
jgi:redox-sensitive bicupin YhaK (pirin superfamily)